MKGVNAVYRGRIVSKDNFRAFIYSPQGERKLVESWDVFESHMASGCWFDAPFDIQARVEPEIVEEKPKRKKREAKPKPVAIEQDSDEVAFDEALFPVAESALGHEVKKDEFLSNF